MVSSKEGNLRCVLAPKWAFKCTFIFNESTWVYILQLLGLASPLWTNLLSLNVGPEKSISSCCCLSSVDSLSVWLFLSCCTFSVSDSRTRSSMKESDWISFCVGFTASSKLFGFSGRNIGTGSCREKKKSLISNYVTFTAESKTTVTRIQKTRSLFHKSCPENFLEISKHLSPNSSKTAVGCLHLYMHWNFHGIKSLGDCIQFNKIHHELFKTWKEEHKSCFLSYRSNWTTWWTTWGLLNDKNVKLQV